MAQTDDRRPVTYYYGARNVTDLFYASELADLASSLPEFRFVPCLSHSWPEDWEHERGLVTDVLGRRERDLAAKDVYLCGPPPMIDAALALLEGHGVPTGQIYFDKFTTTAPGGTAP
jgi:propane monooxygenase reductase subunit